MVLNFKQNIINALPLIINDIDKLNKISSKRFNFCYYKNGKPGMGKTALRIIFKTQTADQEAITLFLKELPKSFELSFLSLITFNNQRYHIPLIDFNLEESSQDLMISTFKGMKKKYGGTIYIFKSGRSFHGYHGVLLTHKIWCEYLGDLLLINQKKTEKHVIDTRWIGHCIKQGFASLRLSANTKVYKFVPEFLCAI